MFSIEYSGRYDLKQYICMKPHMKAIESVKCEKVTNYFGSIFLVGIKS